MAEMIHKDQNQNYLKLLVIYFYLDNLELSLFNYLTISLLFVSNY